MILLTYFLGGLFVGRLGELALQSCLGSSCSGTSFLGTSYFPRTPFSFLPLSLRLPFSWHPSGFDPNSGGLRSDQSCAGLWLEGLTGLIFAFSFVLLSEQQKGPISYNKHPTELIYGLLGFFLLLISLADLKNYRIPSKLLLFIFLLCCSKNNFHFTASNGMGGLLLFCIAFFLKMIYRIWKRQDGLGWGDVKFFSFCGLWIDLEVIPFFLLMTGSSGVLLGIFWQNKKRGNLFPLGPAIAFSLWASSLWIARS